MSLKEDTLWSHYSCAGRPDNLIICSKPAAVGARALSGHLVEDEAVISHRAVCLTFWVRTPALLRMDMAPAWGGPRFPEQRTPSSGHKHLAHFPLPKTEEVVSKALTTFLCPSTGRDICHIEYFQMALTLFFPLIGDLLHAETLQYSSCTVDP